MRTDRSTASHRVVNYSDDESGLVNDDDIGRLTPADENRFRGEMSQVGELLHFRSILFLVFRNLRIFDLADGHLTIGLFVFLHFHILFLSHASRRVH